MIHFRCECGQPIYFDNNRCLGCGRQIGYDPDAAQGSGAMAVLDDHHYRRCANGVNYDVCNWLVAAADPNPFCRSCRLTEIAPDLSQPENLRRWKVLEIAKRRLLYSLLRLGLPLDRNPAHGQPGLSFRFLEDRTTNPLLAEEYVRTGHATGVITINVAEADDVQREVARSLMNEAYRTPLGHCRHESGHFYFDRLIRGGPLEEEFRIVFGDPDQDYEAALAAYYAAPPRHAPEAGYISLYAQAHPLEDWAECWAHYLHIQDTLETAIVARISRNPMGRGSGMSFTGMIEEWMRLSVILNELNRSMGLSDAYPFILTPRIIHKLDFIHRVARPGLPV